jgi:cytochrome c oxidase cbb3-type subunit I/II
MLDPRQLAPKSNMPSFAWLLDNLSDPEAAAGKMRVLKRLGVPYTDGQIAGAATDYGVQAAAIVKNLKDKGVETTADTEIVALIAYLQRLGKNLKPAEAVVAGKEK